jgi:hypothetical protein
MSARRGGARDAQASAGSGGRLQPVRDAAVARSRPLDLVWVRGRSGGHDQNRVVFFSNRPWLLGSWPGTPRSADVRNLRTFHGDCANGTRLRPNIGFCCARRVRPGTRRAPLGRVDRNRVGGLGRGRPLALLLTPNELGRSFVKLDSYIAAPPRTSRWFAKAGGARAFLPSTGRARPRRDVLRATPARMSSPSLGDDQRPSAGARRMASPTLASAAPPALLSHRTSLWTRRPSP